MNGVGSQRITRARQTLLAKLMDTQIWCLPVPVGGRLSKGTMASTSMSVWEKAASTALTLKPDNSVLPVCSSCFLNCCSSVGAQSSESVSKSVQRPFKRNAWDSRSPLFHSAAIPADFHNQKIVGTSLPDTGTLGWNLYALPPQRGTLQPRYFPEVSFFFFKILT